MAIFAAEVLVRFSLDDSLVKDINPSCDIKCDICKEGEWGGAIYLSSTYWEFVCGARLCSDCSAVLEATMDELAQGPVSEAMRADNWGRIPLGIYPAHASPCVSSLRDEDIITKAEEEVDENS